MEYRVIERAASGDEHVETFESAYDAVDFVASLWHRGEAVSARLYIVDTEGSVLLEPFDFYGISRAVSAA